MHLVRRAAQQVGAGLSLSDFDRVLDSMYGGQPSYSGKLVSQQSALAVSAVWSCVNILSGDIATLPFLTYRYVKDGREPAKDHYLWSLLLEEANPEMTAFRFKQAMQAWLCLWGNAYAEIETSGRGQVIALWPWRPDRVKVTREANGRLYYAYKKKDGSYFPAVPQDRMLHLRGFSADGVMGLSPIEVHRQTIGLQLAIIEHGGRLFGNGARPLGILTHKGKLSEKAEKNLKESWMSAHEGLANAHRVAILEEGLNYTEVGMKPVDAQYVQTAGLTNEDICRIFNMPQHRIGASTKTETNSNIEQHGLEYVQYTLGPLGTNWHQEIEASCLSERERKEILVRPNYRSLLRGDHGTMATFISNLTDRGHINSDEVREEFLDMNPLPDGLGKDYYKAVNMAPVQEDNFGKGVNQVRKLTKKDSAPDEEQGAD